MNQILSTTVDISWPLD